MRLTRRSLIQSLSLAIPAKGLPQTPAPAALTPEADLAAARALVLRNAEALASVKIPMATEPAFHFQP